MTAFISGIADSLNEEVARFEQSPLRQPVLINSVPKCGTHLLRNVLRMFVPAEQHHDRDFVQIPNMHQHLDAFNPNSPKLVCGHLLFSDQSAANVRHARHILLVRDPYDWVLARARFFLSDEFDQANIRHLKSGIFSAEELMNMMIFGIHQKTPGLAEIFQHNAVAWLGTAAVLVRYEDVLAAAEAPEAECAELTLTQILDAAGIEKPDDWVDRVRAGANRAHSRTARENLNAAVKVELPTSLPNAQRALVDFEAPGLRKLLGY